VLEQGERDRENHGAQKQPEYAKGEKAANDAKYD
jgi:hypothetical protein